MREQGPEALGQSQDGLVDRPVRVHARDVDERSNEIGVPNIRDTGSARSECAIREDEIEEELALGWRRATPSHDGALDHRNPVPPVRIFEGLEHVSR